MIVDTSALVAIFADEPERERFIVAIAEASQITVSGGSWLEFGTVLVRRFGVAAPKVPQSQLERIYGLRVQPVSSDQIAAAVAAYAAFGRGARHPARLNFGDCFSYALAKATGEPLLFKGDDFNHTDLRLAEASSYPRG